MKTKAQKQDEVKKGREFLGTSQTLVFTDVTKVSAEDVRKLRGELRGAGARLLVIKKRLLSIILKEKDIAFDPRESKMSVATVFSPVSSEKASAIVFKFFKEKNLEKEKILGGYDIVGSKVLTANDVRFLGQLPPREVLLGQLLGQLTGPLRTFLYILDQKSKQKH